MGTALLNLALDGDYIPLKLEDDESIFDDESDSNDLVGLEAISNDNRPGQDDVYQRSGIFEGITVAKAAIHLGAAIRRGRRV